MIRSVVRHADNKAMARPTFAVRDVTTAYMHESCAKLPQEVQSPFHPPHPLTLQRKRVSNNHKCNASNEDFWTGFNFCCDECNFKFVLQCALIRMLKVYEEGDGRGQLHT